MEESEKRRERLRAMRSEASEAEGSPSLPSAGTGVLTNPLVETPIVPDSHTISRFDYYTDPMAAYSGNKRQNNFRSSSQDNPMSHVGGGRGSPMMQLPPPPPLGPGNPQMTSQPNYYANQELQHGWRPPYYGPGPVRTPMLVFNPPPEHHPRSFSNQPNNPSGQYLPRNMPRPGFQWAPRVGSPHSSVSTITNPGHGGPHFPNSGRGRSRGIGYQGNSSTPPNLYRKSMVEDPWKDLKPVVWRAAVTSEMFQKFSSSLSTKRPRVEEACSIPKSSKESLADYLSAAFDEAIDGGDAL